MPSSDVNVRPLVTERLARQVTMVYSRCEHESAVLEPDITFVRTCVVLPARLDAHHQRGHIEMFSSESAQKRGFRVSLMAPNSDQGASCHVAVATVAGLTPSTTYTFMLFDGRTQTWSKPSLPCTTLSLEDAPSRERAVLSPVLPQLASQASPGAVSLQCAACHQYLPLHDFPAMERERALRPGTSHSNSSAHSVKQGTHRSTYCRSCAAAQRADRRSMISAYYRRIACTKYDAMGAKPMRGAVLGSALERFIATGRYSHLRMPYSLSHHGGPLRILPASTGVIPPRAIAHASATRKANTVFGWQMQPFLTSITRVVLQALDPDSLLAAAATCQHWQYVVTTCPACLIARLLAHAPPGGSLYVDRVSIPAVVPLPKAAIGADSKCKQKIGGKQHQHPHGKPNGRKRSKQRRSANGSERQQRAARCANMEQSTSRMAKTSCASQQPIVV